MGEGGGYDQTISYTRYIPYEILKELSTNILFKNKTSQTNVLKKITELYNLQNLNIQQ